jgi:transposase-like protein
MQNEPKKPIPPCPHCGSTCVRKRGTDTNRDPQGGPKGIPIQVWHCRDCGHTYRTLRDPPAETDPEV